jgi:ABC-type taurine transport system ATPase subunit
VPLVEAQLQLHGRSKKRRVVIVRQRIRGGIARERRIDGPGADRGMVFQSYTLFPWLTVLGNVCFGLVERGLPREQQLDIAHGFLAKVGLKGFDRHYPKQLSGGVQQRTAIARWPTTRACC